jgi:hypothetical protein
MDMDIQHGQEAMTLSKDMQHGHAACPGSMDMHHLQESRTRSMDLQHEHAAWIKDTQHGSSA